MGNAMLRNDAAKNYFLARQNKKSKIDGVMTCILGVMVWKTEVEESVTSIYEQRGMRML
jgi:phage terminase large subunit-like protein